MSPGQAPARPPHAVTTAASCEIADVQAAIDDAGAGDVVQIPAGTCDWGGATATSVAGIRLRGAGMGQTTIRRSSAASGSYALEIDCDNGLRAELSDIAFEGLDDDDVLDNGVLLDNGCRDFKVHDARFAKFSMAGLEIDGSRSRGVVSASEFGDNLREGWGYGIVVYGDYDWPTLDLGGPEAVFVEDNYFSTNRHSIASNYGSRYVLRHNTLVTTNASRNTSMVDAHGRQDGSARGSRGWEIYDNHLLFDDDGYQADGISIRGGDGVIFNNTLTHSHQGRIAYVAQFVIEDNGCADTEPVQGPAGPYPVPDQTRAAWVWNNTWDGDAEDRIRTSDGNSFDCGYYLQEGRDYFQFAKPGYVPYAYPHPLRADADTIFEDSFE